MLLFIVGYMGVGKSTIAMELASSIDFRFIDTDEWIESRLCMTVQEIFEKHGEVFFREKEKECIEFLLGQEDLVVATGGGLPCNNDLMNLMNEMGQTIYLKLAPSVLANRIWDEKNKRPLVATISSKNELVGFISSHLSIREEIYSQATYVIDVENYSQSDLCTHIKKLIR